MACWSSVTDCLRLSAADRVLLSCKATKASKVSEGIPNRISVFEKPSFVFLNKLTPSSVDFSVALLQQFV